ncbi:MAG: hypothetical protein M5R36_18640 [Deltaproteobacteria bacterium]|nr:hypothetical protein [Deltaproteobacteria bacterium]
MRSLWFAMLLLCVPMITSVGCGCGGDDDDDSSDVDDDADDDTSDDDDTAADDDDDPPFSVRWDYLLVDVPAPPANPTTLDETPASLNYVPVFRFRQETGDAPPRAVEAVLIIVAGYTAGANQIRSIAEEMVTLSEGAFEVWVPDRRFHLLEDVVGSNAAEAAGNPYLAYDYYYNGLEVNGRTFQGYFDPRSSDSAMMSEWGLDQEMIIYRRLLELIPEEARATNVFFGGHSRGAYFAQALAAYEFEDGKLGNDEIAGLILLDGGPRYEPDYTEAEYLDDIAGIRSGDLPRTTSFSFFTPGMYTFLEIFSMAAADGLGDPFDPTLGPDGVFPHNGPFTVLRPFMTRFHDVGLTNEAFVGLVADDEFGLLENFHGHMGRMTGGEICHDFLGDFPCEDGAMYSWLDYNEVEPHELMSVQKLITNIFEGPSNNADPYYPARIDIDFYVADVLETEGTWRDDYFRFRTSQVDAPVFVMGTHLVADTGLMEQYRDQLPPVRGYDMPRTDIGFDILYKDDWEHIDGLQVEPEYNDLYTQLADWVNTWSSGEVAVPLFGTPWDDVADQYPPEL